MKATQVCIIAVLLACSQIAIAKPSGISKFDGPSNSTQPPGKFECTSAGQFPDPQDCKAYHVCIFVPAIGDFQDNFLRCPPELIYCQAEEVCVFEGYNGCKC